MLSDEEKKAIEYLKQNSIPILRYDNFGNILSPLYYGTFEKEIILNLIEKQSKEIEELKNTETYKIAIIDKYKYISKDKIKAKIEEYKKEIEAKRNLARNPMDRVSERLLTDSIVELEKTKKVLQSLLEKEQ